MKPTHLIGDAARIHHTLSTKLTRINPREDVFKQLVHGTPGSGKSTLIAMIAAQMLTGKVPAIKDLPAIRRCSEWSCVVESISGASVNVDIIRQWHGTRGMFSMFGDWRIRIIEELDAVPHVAQTAMLDYLDKLPPGTAILATSNADTDLFQDRFQSRFQAWKCNGPDASEILALITSLHPDMPPAIANQIATLSAGNVRQAMLECESWLDVQLAA